MYIGLIFWILMILWLINWLGGSRFAGNYPWAPHVNSILIFVLLFLLGWKVFGFIVQG